LAAFRGSGLDFGLTLVWLVRKSPDSLPHAFVPLAIDDGDIEEWSRLMAVARAKGVALSDNDLWIAATASSRGHALITCDRDHQRIAPELPIEVVFLAPPV
jgi:predicted nucleic acid-binding protein